MHSSSASITLLALGITSIAVLAVKAATHEKGTTFLRGGWPSGHTALAFAVATAIGYSVELGEGDDTRRCSSRLLVGQSRAESGAHTIPQIVAGAVLGFLLSTAAFQIFWR